MRAGPFIDLLFFCLVIGLIVTLTSYLNGHVEHYFVAGGLAAALAYVTIRIYAKLF